MMHSKWLVAAGLASSMMIGTAYAQEAKDERQTTQAPKTMKMEDLPAPVKSTVKSETQGKKIESIKQETKEGATVYEVNTLKNGKKETLEISDTGKVLERHPATQEKMEKGAGEKAPDQGGY